VNDWRSPAASAFSWSPESLAMAAVSWLSLHLFQSMFDSGNTILLRLGVVSLVLMISSKTFLCVARLLKLKEAAHILNAASDLFPGRGTCQHRESMMPSKDRR
jgi:hypothetical protein